ncbi:MAG TPA: carbohydrate ABC transporter permease [Trueperaceae bacterium]
MLSWMRSSIVNPEHPLRPGPWGTVLVLLILGVLGFLALIPLYWMFVTSLTPSVLTMEFPPDLFPKQPSLDNFRSILERPNFRWWVLNSTIMAVTITAMTLVLASTAGYAFGKLRFAGSRPLFWTHILAMMLPFEAILVPLFIIVVRMGMVDTYWGLIVPLLANPFSVFLMKQFIQTLPTELLDSARIDGASEVQVFWHVVLPLVRPGLAFLGIITFVAQWNSFVWPLVVTNSSEMRTLQVGLVLLREEVPLFYGMHMAGAVLAAIPVVLVFFAFQRYFLRGVTVGALKG